jgi:hypothetical protein
MNNSNPEMGSNSRTFGSFTSSFRLIVAAILLAFLLIIFFAPASYSFASSTSQQGQNSVASRPSGVSIFYLLNGCVKGKALSCNWAGYYAYNGTVMNPVTMVNGSWIQPTVKSCSGITRPQYAMFAVGIDGAPSGSHDDTIQAGTAAECSGTSSTPSYFAWYEVWDIFTCPSGCGVIILPITISAGNVINTILTGTCSSGGFSGTVTLNDITTGKSISTAPGLLFIPPNDGALCTSAEWITEAPVNIAPLSSLHIYPLAHFGIAKFGLVYTRAPLTCYATVAGTTGPIGGFVTAASTNMYNSKGSAIASTSALVKTDSFKVKRT